MFDFSSWMPVINQVLFRDSYKPNYTRPHKESEPQKPPKPFGKSGWHIKFRDKNGDLMELRLNAWNETDAWAEVLQFHPQAQLIEMSGMNRLTDPYS